MSDKRVRRPEAERDEPIRSWTGMFTSPGARSDGEATRAFDQDVTMGYRVIEEFMRRGAVAARDVSQQFASIPDPRANAELVERFFQSASDLGSTWLQLMQALWLTPPAPGPRQEPGPFAVQQTPVARVVPEAKKDSPDLSAPAQAPRPTVTFRLNSSRAVEVSATLGSNLGAGPFVVHDLRALDPALPCIGPVRFEYEPERERALASLEIPDAHQPATYSGVIVDAMTQLPAGSITVRVL